MFTQRTVLVLGAGASIPFGFPSGPGLTRGIVASLNASYAKGSERPRFRELLADLGSLFSPPEIDRFCVHLASSDRRSIDSFLEDRSEFLDIGKAAIAAALLPLEHQGAVISNEDRWYGYLLDRLPRRPEDLNGRLSVITFNYDRTLEQYLFTTLMHRFGLEDEAAARAVAQVPIVHFYGSLGVLPFQAKSHNANVIPFGVQRDARSIKWSANQIRIMSERHEENPAIEQAHDLLRKAERVIFLGFGYDQTNLERLLAYKPSPNTGFMGTAIGMTVREVELIERRLSALGCVQLSRPDILGDDKDTLDFLRKHCLFD